MGETKRPLTVPSASALLDVVVGGRRASISAWPGVLLFCGLAVLAAQVRVPVPGTDVPLTLQSLVVLLAGFALSPGRALSAMLAYVALGVVGLPVFAAGSHGVLGPTGGYIIGFIAGAWVVSFLKGGGDASYLRLLIAGAAGTAVVFAFGVVGRVLWSGGDVPWALMTGLVPFAAKGGLQMFLAATLVKALRSRRCDRYAGRTL